jgi:hypothetical protein
MAAGLAKPRTFGVSLDDFDGHELARFEIAAKLDLAMHATAELIDDLVLVYELSARDGISVDFGEVGLFRHLALSEMKVRA